MNGRVATATEEDEIVEAIKYRLQLVRKERRYEILLGELLAMDCELESVGHGSVIFSFWCRTQQAQLRLMLWVDNGRLKSMIEALANKFLHEKFGTVCIAMVWIKRFNKGK